MKIDMQKLKIEGNTDKEISDNILSIIDSMVISSGDENLVTALLTVRKTIQESDKPRRHFR